jgi:hypothetical protein
MKCTSAFAAWCACAFLLLLPASAPAPTVVADSIEWLLTTSDRVFIGKVINVDKVTDRDNKPCQAVTVAISNTLKGVHTQRETFVLPAYIYHGYAEQWMEEAIPIVFFLLKNDGKRASFPPDRFAWVLRDNQIGPDAVLLGKSKYYWTGCIPVLTRDFEVLTETDTIVKFLEKTVKAAGQHKTPQPHTLAVPGDTAVYKKLWQRSAVFLVVPVDARLEILGQKWCKSDWPHQRAEAAKVLGHFKTEKNIALLKSLLNDSNSAEETLHRTVPGTTELELVYRKRVYYVRQAAFVALRDLGAKVDKPVLQDLLEGRDEPDAKLDDRKPRR